MKNNIKIEYNLSDALKDLGMDVEVEDGILVLDTDDSIFIGGGCEYYLPPIERENYKERAECYNKVTKLKPLPNISVCNNGKLI